MTSSAKLKGDVIFGRLTFVSGILVLVAVVGILLTLVIFSYPSIKEFGFKFFTGLKWDPVLNVFGSLPFLVGTLITSFLALVISFPFSISISIFLGEYSKSGVTNYFLKTTIELLAGIPSVIYGFWALFVLVPLIRIVQLKLGIAPYGVGIVTASIILAVMIIPYSALISSEVINLVPYELKEASYSLGATRYEVIRKIILPYSKSGIFAGILLSLGRALGETMAVTMVIGNSNFLPKSFFDSSNTIASLIANEFTEATGKLYLSSLIEIGLLLFIVTAVINIIGRKIIKSTTITG